MIVSRQPTARSPKTAHLQLYAKVYTPYKHFQGVGDKAALTNNAASEHQTVLSFVSKGHLQCGALHQDHASKALEYVTTY